MFLAIISASCDLFDHEPKMYSTRLALSLQDTLSNDLISGIECTKCYPSLDSLCEIKNRDVFLLNNEYTVSMQKYGGYYYVNLNIGVDKKIETFPNKVTFTLRSPYVFGDNYSHNVVTYWEHAGKGKWDYVCSRVEYGGKEFTVKQLANINIATIILDR